MNGTGTSREAAPGGELQVPSAFVPGYEKARLIDPGLAARYVAHLWVGDPLADAVMKDLGGLDGKEAARLIGGAIELDERVLRDAPQSLQDLIQEATTVPAWYDPMAGQRGCQAFLRNSDHVLAAFVAGAIVEGFATMISKSFAITGRLIDDGVRRLKQNIRHLLDIFMPGGVEPSGDGWKLTMRIRMVHARVRWLFQDAEEWDYDAWGMPVSAAHTTLAAAAFSARMIECSEMLGALLDDDDRAGLMEIWSYTAWIMGAPEALLFHNKAEGLHLLRVATACEPEPDFDAVALAHCIVNSAPVVVGVRDPAKRQAAAQYIFRVSRELVGDARAESLRFPARHGMPLLPWLRTKVRFQRGMGRLFPAWGKARSRRNFLHILDLADLGETRFSYHLPDEVQSDRSSRW